jgi:hypothetical protein
VSDGTEDYWPGTEAVPLLQELEELVCDATTERPFFGYDGMAYDEDDNRIYPPPTEAGVKALAAIRARFKEIEEALY